MRLILDAAAGTSVRRSTSAQSDEWPTMTVIGAGNCQDIDLTTLAVAFSEIRLIDIDAVAVACAVSRLPADVTSQIRIFAPIDIAAPLMSVAAFVSLDPAQRAAVLAAVESAEMPERLPVSDVVVSACLLSQLLDSASQIAPPESSDYLPLMQAVRRGHLLRLLSLTAPGGRVLLITDLVSSDTVQELAKTLSAELPKLMFQCLQSGNFSRASILRSSSTTSSTFKPVLNSVCRVASCRHGSGTSGHAATPCTRSKWCAALQTIKRSSSAHKKCENRLRHWGVSRERRTTWPLTKYRIAGDARARNRRVDCVLHR